MPTQVPPSFSARDPPEAVRLPPQKTFNMVGSRPTSLRTREEIEESGAYERPQFVPKPIRKLKGKSTLGEANQCILFV